MERRARASERRPRLRHGLLTLYGRAAEGARGETRVRASKLVRREKLHYEPIRAAKCPHFAPGALERNPGGKPAGPLLKQGKRDLS